MVAGCWRYVEQDAWCVRVQRQCRRVESATLGPLGHHVDALVCANCYILAIKSAPRCAGGRSARAYINDGGPWRSWSALAGPVTVQIALSLSPDCRTSRRQTTPEGALSVDTWLLAATAVCDVPRSSLENATTPLSASRMRPWHLLAERRLRRSFRRDFWRRAAELYFHCPLFQLVFLHALYLQLRAIICKLLPIETVTWVVSHSQLINQSISYSIQDILSGL